MCAGDTSGDQYRGGRRKRGMHVYIEPSHVIVQQKLTFSIVEQLCFKFLQRVYVSADSRKYIFDDELYVILNIYFGRCSFWVICHHNKTFQITNYFCE